MNTDNPDTVSMEEQTHWEATQVDDVFQPAVRVQLAWRDIEAAVNSGAIVPSQAHALWANWAHPGSPLRVVNQRAPAAAPGVQAELPVDHLDDQGLKFQQPASSGGLAWLFSLVIGFAVGALATYLVL